jgi:hypothetical protein
MSSTNKSLTERYAELQKREAAFERRLAIEPELKKFVEKGSITLAQKSAFSDIFSAIPDDLGLSFSAYDGKGVYEFLWYFLNHIKSSGETASFAAAPKKKNCSKGVSCGNACISGNKICRKPLTPIQKEEVKEVLAVAPVPAKVEPTKAVPMKAIAPKPKTLDPKIAKPIVVSEDTGDPVKLNQNNLDAARSQIVKKSSEEAVKASESAAAAILQSKNTGIFVKVSSNQVLAGILEDRFKNSVELGSDAKVPGLKGSYQDARKRVEREQMGYQDDIDPTKRPIYSYLGNNKDLGSASHGDVAAFGDITIKLKDAVKDRATFTGADSFKSGIASRISSPSVASLIQSRKHGQPNAMEDVKGQIDRIGKAKNIDDLMSATSGIGNRYVEAQIHGQVRPEDIGEIHFKSTGEPPIPSKSIRDWAEKNGVAIYQNDKPYKHLEVSESRRKEIADTITKKDFDQYLASKATSLRQLDPKTAHNQTFEQWKTTILKEYTPEARNELPDWAKKNYDNNLARATSENTYKKEIKSAISDGIHLPESVVAGLPDLFTEKEAASLSKKSATNKDNSASTKDYHNEIDSILQSPIISDEEKIRYKPRMTQQEAEEYTKGSKLEGFDFYHGGSADAIESIAGSGVKISLNTASVYGGGFYMGGVKEIAESYASDSTAPSYATTRVKMKNPLVYENSDELRQDLEGKFGLVGTDNRNSSFGNRFGDTITANWTAMLKLKGYDGIYAKDNSYLVAFEKEQVVTHNTSKARKNIDAPDPDRLRSKTQNIDKTLRENKLG